MRKIGSDTILKAYIIIVLYSSVLKLILGRWGTLVADVATITAALYCIYSNGNFKITYSKKVRVIFIAILFVQIIAIFEMANSNINNHLYSLIEYRKSYFQMLSLIVSYWLIRKAKVTISDLLRFIGIVSIPIILYGVKQYFFWSGIDNLLLDMNDADFTTLRYAGHIRSISIFSGPFHYGLFCVLLYSVYVFLTITVSRKFIIAAIIAVAGIFCSITRTNTVCMVIASGIWYLMFVKNNKKKKSMAVKMLSIVVIAVMLISCAVGLFDTFLLSSNTPLASLFNSLSNVEADTRFTGRIERWIKAINAIIDHPFLGYGVGSAADTMEMHNISNVYVTSHNMVLKLFMETGILGLYFYLLVYFKSAKRIVAIYHNNYYFRALFYSLLSSIFVNGLVGSTIGSFPSITLFWILSGILVGADNCLVEAKEEGEFS